MRDGCGWLSTTGSSASALPARWTCPHWRTSPITTSSKTTSVFIPDIPHNLPAVVSPVVWSPAEVCSRRRGPVPPAMSRWTWTASRWRWRKSNKSWPWQPAGTSRRGKNITEISRISGSGGRNSSLPEILFPCLSLFKVPEAGEAPVQTTV